MTKAEPKAEPPSLDEIRKTARGWLDTMIPDSDNRALIRDIGRVIQRVDELLPPWLPKTPFDR